MGSAKKRRSGSGSSSGGAHNPWNPKVNAPPMRSLPAKRQTGPSLGVCTKRSAASGGVHSTAARSPVKKRRVDSGSFTAAGPLYRVDQVTGGGSQHSTATTRLLFADAGCFDEELIDHLVAGTPRTR